MKSCCKTDDEPQKKHKGRAIRYFLEGLAGMLVFPRNFFKLNIKENLFDITERDQFYERPEETFVPQ